MTRNSSINNFSNFTGVYCFGFNGKESDSEGMGGGLSTYDYGFRIYNPSLGKFLSVDPLSSKFAFYSVYQYAGNKPIACIDLDGLEDIYYMPSFWNNQGRAALWIMSQTQIGSSVLNEFRNTDPNKFEGHTNKGYDAFVCRYEEPANYMGDTHAIYVPGNKVRCQDESGKVTLEDQRDIMLESLENRSGYYYEKMKDFIPDEVLLSPHFRESLEKGRGIILVVLNSLFVSNNFSLEASGVDADATTHEFGAHANRISQGVQNTLEADHEEWCGTHSPYTIVTEGSKQYLMQKQVGDAINNFNQTLRTCGDALLKAM